MDDYTSKAKDFDDYISPHVASIETSSQPGLNIVNMINPCSCRSKIPPHQIWQEAHWATGAACIGSGIWKIITCVAMLQITKQCPESKEEATTEIITSTRVKHLLSIPVILWLLASPHTAKTPDKHPVCCVIGAPVIVSAHKMLEAHEEHQVSQDGRAADE